MTEDGVLKDELLSLVQRGRLDQPPLHGRERLYRQPEAIIASHRAPFPLLPE
jgi:hypothetical protein